MSDLILEEYADEHLYEDGELNQSQVEDKIIKLWRQGKIVLAQYVKIGEYNG